MKKPDVIQVRKGTEVVVTPRLRHPDPRMHLTLEDCKSFGPRRSDMPIPLEWEGKHRKADGY